MTRVIVTGGRGLVGHAYKQLIDIVGGSNASDTFEYHFITRQDCDLRNRDQVLETFNKIQPHIVVHLASHVGGVYDNMNNNYTYLMDNIAINCNIVEACKRTRVGKLVNILSTCIFPDIANNPQLVYPLQSKQLHDGLPHDSNIGYAYSKRVLHVASEILARTPDCPTQVVNIIPTNLYGENDNYNIQSAHVIPALVHKTVLAKQSGSPLQVRGSGLAMRQFLYAGDLARIIHSFVTQVYRHDSRTITFIASPPSDTEISIRHVVELICKILEFTGKVEYDSTDSIGQVSKTTSNVELKRFVPDFQFTDFENGLRNTIDYFVKHYDNLRI